MKGNYQKATDKYREILLETIEKEPQELECLLHQLLNERGLIKEHPVFVKA